MARDKKIPMTVHLPADVVAALKDEQFGDTFSAVVTDRIRQAFGMGPREAAPASPMDDLDMRKKQAEVATAELRSGILRRKYVITESALAMVARDYANIKSRLNTIPQSLIGATPEQVDDLKKIVQDCFTDLSAENPATWDDLRDEAASNPP